MAVVAGLLFPASALAQEPAVGVDDDVQHTFSLTMSPVHLIFPIGEVTGEYRVADKLGVAVVLGAGRVTTQAVTMAGGVPTVIDSRFTAFEGGAQVRYYLLGSFIHGMQVGAEIMYLYVDRDEADSVSASGEGLALGPFVGYKIATNIGFTFDAQLGFEYVAARAKASVANTSVTADAKDIVVLLNLNVGWSF